MFFNNFTCKNVKQNNNWIKLKNVIFIIILVQLNSFVLVLGDCRHQEQQSECEAICYNNECEIRIAVLLPTDLSVEASQQRVIPVLELVANDISEANLISNISIKFLPYNDQCDASYATISSMDAYARDCAHIIIGPSCEYALASVSRIIKHYRLNGMPLITPGGYSNDFVKKKVTCDDEYYMLVRTGLLSFTELSNFMIEIMRKYKWSRTVLLYERSGHYNVAGLHTCHLHMQTMAQLFRDAKLSYTSFVTDSSVTNMTENLKREVGLEQATYAKTNGDGDTKLLQAVLPAIQMAIEKVQEKDNLLYGFNITMDYRDTNCSSITGPLAAFELVTNNRPDVFFGPFCDYVLAPILRYSTVWNIPILTAGGLASAFDYKDKEYYQLIRVMGKYTDVGSTIRDILKEFNWKTVAFIFHNIDKSFSKGHSNCHHSLSGIYAILDNPDLFKRDFDEEKSGRDDYIEILQLIKDRSRIVIMCGNATTIREIMLAAEELNMVDSGEYVFFNIDLFSSMTATRNKPWEKIGDTDENNNRAKNAYSALLTVTAKQPEDDRYMEFSEDLKLLASTKYNYTFTEEEPVSTFVTAFYDAVLLFAYALNDSMKESETILFKPLNGSALVRHMWNRNFTGITGNVVINSNGDRISGYSLLDMNPKTYDFEIVANYYQDTGLQYVEGKKIHWSGGRETAPPDKPTCGYDNSLCPDTSLPGYAILSMILGFSLVLILIIAILGYRHYKLEAEINSMTWKVNWGDVLPCNPNSKHRNSIHSLKRGSQVTIYSEDINSLGGDRQLYIPIGFYKGCKAAIKKINVHDINLNRSLMLQLKKLKDLQHDHLVKFYGACVDPPDCCLLTEYCPKGSLQDILENEQYKLDMMFKLSLMHDIARGMQFLHSTDINSHGTLKSSNCVVDSRFVLKLTDFGLHELRKPFGEDVVDIESYAYWKRLLWTAPELLRMDNPPLKGTQKGDVYSFAIIVHEILTRQGPFFTGDDKSPKEIVSLVKDSPKLYLKLLRPNIDDYSYEDINNMMVKCWSEEPNERPDFAMIKSIIRKINKENESGNILDNLLKRMEMYATNLEVLVQERTQDYLEEKRKCEELLYQLLPKSVAAQLISGKSVIAETYDQVTIYFSDIVGFTSISAESTPMQVIDLLNDLYTCFDSIIENYDVYKVETIGDAYMVVSGLPIKNDNLHAREISKMALALLKAVYKFTIRHRPNEQLKLRIGLHSGPCVAGVIGLKMPRYCLFGDTVNTASRMESNGEALKIHISESTKQILDTVGGFDIVKRGLVEMKGKGSMCTYWLNGETSPSPNLQKSSTSEIDNLIIENSNGYVATTNDTKLNNNLTCNLNNIKNKIKSQYITNRFIGDENLRNNASKQPLLAKH